MPKFPVDAPKRPVLRALASLGFRVVTSGSTLPWFVKTLTERARR